MPSRRRVPPGSRAGGQFLPERQDPPPPPRRPATRTPSAPPGPALDALERALPDIPKLPGPGERPEVRILRGLPASGKSTFARAVIAAHPPGTVARVNNDDLAAMLFGVAGEDHSADAAASLAAIRVAALRGLLAAGTARMILVDNTNLSARTVRALAREARAAGARPVIDDRFMGVPLDECLRRNAARDRPVPEPAILRMHRQASRAPAPDELDLQVQPYPNDDPALPATSIVDIDGTLAVMSASRSPYDWSRVGEDTPNPPVVSVVRALLAQGGHVTVMSGRDETCRAETQAWLDRHVAPGLPLAMRPSGDGRPDDIVKHELFRRHVAGRYRVSLVLDDRASVVALWRRLGLPCWQVADGDF